MTPSKLTLAASMTFPARFYYESNSYCHFVIITYAEVFDQLDCCTILQILCECQTGVIELNFLREHFILRLGLRNFWRFPRPIICPFCLLAYIFKLAIPVVSLVANISLTSIRRHGEGFATAAFHDYKLKQNKLNNIRLFTILIFY